MHRAVQQQIPIGTPAQIGADCTDLVDLRFRTLVGEAAWLQLPQAIRQRFSKRIAPDATTVYRGKVILTELSRAGTVLAQLARLIGAPLPLNDGAVGESTVRVTEAAGEAGQTWLRSYTRPDGTQQIVRSMKCFTGTSGLEERVGGGFGMALAVMVDEGGLIFRSEHYFFDFAGVRLLIPPLLSPGLMEIVHRQETSEDFSFRLTLTHRIFGRLVHQLATFRDP